MKIQSLAVIFVIIILPISIVLSEYIETQTKTLSLQTLYNSSLTSATYDAVKAYQINSVNNSSNDIANSKIRDITASANTFLNSIKSNFKLSGNNSKTINDYVPAIVYTMYDGYYIYSPYINNIDEIYTEENTWATYKNGERIDGLKPYIYYSCRYNGNNCDVVITYSLDNYITIQGYVGTEYWNESGYFLSKVNKNGDAYTYNSVPIPLEETLTEKIYDSDTGKVEEYKYAKIDGTKYYLDYNRQVFYMQNGEKNYSPSNTPEILNDYINKIEHNSSAYNFYKDAYAFTEKIKGSNLIGLSFRDSRDQNGNTISETGFIGEDKIFGGIVSAEDKSSNFSEHRVAVIRYSIEKNLTTAIANYDEKFGGDLAFSMPTLSEQDWYNLTNKTSVITFLQGFPMGTRLYNSYVVVTNNKNRDAITQDSIYIATSDGQYHSIYEKDLNNLTGLTGYLNVDFERRTLDGTHYYYPREETGAYTSIVNQTETVEVEDIDTYMQDNSSLAQAYYTALGRERYSMYRGAN